MRNAGLEEAQAGIKIAGRNINNLRYADDTTLMAENEEEPKSLFMRMKEEKEKVGLKLNIQKMKIMASGPITSWEIDGETVETVSDFIFWGSKITGDGDCSHEIERRLLLGRKVMTNLDSILKSRYITLPTRVRLVKAMFFLFCFVLFCFFIHHDVFTYLFKHSSIHCLFINLFIHPSIHSLLESRAVLYVTTLFHGLDLTDGLALKCPFLFSHL